MPLDPAYKKLELDAIIDQIPGLLTITNKEYSKKIGKHSQPIITVDNLLLGISNPINELRLDPAMQIASLTFTSGTTGTPKAVPNTHSNHIWNIKVCSKIWNWTASDSLLISLPLSHWYGIVMGLSGVLCHGNTLYLQEWFSAKDTLEALSSGNISLFTHAAPAYIKLLQAPDDGYDLSAVRLCISGGAPLPPAIWHEFKQRYGIEILETYGSSETGRIAGNDLASRVLGSPGRPLPGVNVKFSDKNEILIKSPGVFPGYYNNQKETLKSQTEDGFWATGDIGELKDGYIYLKGRRQERIRRFGYTVSPRDVEWALLKIKGISDAYVLGRQQVGEPNDQLIYFLVGTADNKTVDTYCKENLLFAWRPDRIIRLDDLPRTGSGKPKIPELKKLAGLVDA